MELQQIRKRVYDIGQQAKRRKNASGLKRHLEIDLDIIEGMVDKVMSGIDILDNETKPIIDTPVTEIEQPYFDKKGKEIKEFAVLKVYHFFGVNDQGRGRKHHYMYKWVCLEEYKGKKYWSALHLTNGDGGKFRLRAIADKQTRKLMGVEIVQQY